MKKTILGLMLVCMIVVLSGCGVMTGRTLDSLFTAGNTGTAAFAEENSDYVTISRAEYEELSRFRDVATLYNAVTQLYYKDTDSEKLIDYSAKGLMAGLGDLYSYYYTPEEFAKMWEEEEGSYAGIGVLISTNYRTHICTISRVFKGSPAEAAGVQRRDIIYRVGDMYVSSDNIEEAVKIMRGTPGTDVDVTFLRDEEEITITLTRADINVNQIESKMLDAETGLIALYGFSGRCELEFENALNELLAQGARGIIIDLRDNGGGWVDQARYIGDLFMDEGELCYMVMKNGEEEHAYPTRDGKADVKLVMLVNENSASSSEILTCALRDCADATVVGTKTFGKGVVQSLMAIGNRGAGFQVTVAEYYSPSGYQVNEKGIEPDVVVELAEDDNGMYDFGDTEKDPQLKAAWETLKEKMK